MFTTAAVFTLALGIGGTTAIFTLIDAVMLRSLPVANPSALWRIGDNDECCVRGVPQDRWGYFSYPLYQRLKAGAPEFDDVTAFQAGISRFSVRRAGSPEPARPLSAEYVTGNYFSVLSVKAYGGRLFTPDDDRPSAPPMVVLSHHAWQLAYGGDPSVVGSNLIVEGHPFTVVGVAAPGFFGETLRGDPPDLWVPVNQEPLLSGADSAMLRQSSVAWLRLIGRLRPGASTTGMAPRLTALLREWIQYEAAYPSNWMPDVIRNLPRQFVAVVPAGAGVDEMKEGYSNSLHILLGVCGVVLLIGCANVANLLLARSATRRTQTAVRLAVGASRRQIVGLALTESIILALGGCIVGIGVAIGAARLLLLLAFQHTLFLPLSVMPSPAVLGCALAVSLATGIIFGAAPAWLATRTDPAEALRGSGRAISAHSSWGSKALVALQACLSVVLVAGACMLARSLDKLQSQNFGYALDGHVIVSMNPPAATYTIPKLNALYRDLEQRLARLPGVRGSGLALYNPLTNNWSEMIYVAGHPAPKMDDNAGASWDRVSPHFLPSFGIPVLRGRGFTEADNETSDLVAVVNQTFAKRFFREGEDPVGRQFGLDKPEFAHTFRIVGVVGDAKFASWAIRRPALPMFFVPLAQRVPYPAGDMLERIELRSHYVGGLMLATNATPGALEPLITKILADVDPNLTITSVRTMREQVALRFDQDRAVAGLAGLFGAVALLLAAVGLYGVTAFGVAQRRNEIGIRMALGAGRGRVIRLVLRATAARVGFGLALGMPLAIAAGRLLQSRLYGVTNWDPVALGVAAGALALCASAAAIIPARRAASIPAVEALRSE